MSNNNDNEGFYELLVDFLRSDLLLFLTIVVIADITLTLSTGTVLDVVVGAWVLLFAPGYALTLALFPASLPRTSKPTTRFDTRGNSRPQVDREVVERLLLSVSLSFVIVAILAYGVLVSSVAFEPLPLLFGVTLVTVTATLVAARRRQAIPVTDQFRPSLKPLSAVASRLPGRGSGTSPYATVALLLVLVVAIGGAVPLLSVADSGGQYTEFYLLSEDESGELSASEYPTQWSEGEPQELVFGIENHEMTAREFTVVVAIQRVAIANESVQSVREQQELDRFSQRLEPNETWRQSHELNTTITGDQLRLTYLLYNEDVPESPTVSNATKKLHLWISVEPTPESDRTQSLVVEDSGNRGWTK